jgi:hypothetical protein
MIDTEKEAVLNRAFWEDPTVEPVVSASRRIGEKHGFVMEVTWDIYAYAAVAGRRHAGQGDARHQPMNG